MKFLNIAIAILKIPFKIWSVIADGFKKGYTGSRNGDKFK